MSEVGSYWSDTLRSRLSRRRMLRAGAAAGAGAIALSLIGCGGDDSKSDGGGSNLVSKPVDTTNKAVKGTVLPLYQTQDILQYNTEGNGAAATAANHGYSRMVRFKSIKYPEPRSATVEADAMLSWEISPDGATYTFKLRPNQTFDPRPPTSGRVMTTQDVKFSWDRFAQINPYGPNLANVVDKAAPVLGVDAVDSTTVVMRLAYPYGGLLPQLAFTRHFVVLPVEADDKFKTGDEMRGSGAWRVKQYERSAFISYEPNPDWYDAGKILAKEKLQPIIGEYATGLAQLRAGNLGMYEELQPQDVLPTKRDLPRLQMTAKEEFTQGGQSIRFGWLPESPYRDERLRQATSMLIDRNLFIDTFYNTDQFEREGLSTPRRWHTVIPVGYDDFWLDPADPKKFGENARYYEYNAAEAKKLVQAATGGKGVDTDFIWTANGYGAEFNRMAEVLHQMWTATGDFRLKNINPDYQAEWRPRFNRNFGQYSGISLGSAGSGTPDVDGQIVARLQSGNNERTGHVADDGKPDQTLEKLIADQRKELDPTKRQAIIYEIQRYCAKKMYWLMDAGEALGYRLSWGWLGNYGVYRGWTGGAESTEVQPYYWINEAERKKA